MKTRKVLYISWQAQTTSTDTVYYRQHLHDLEKKCRPLQCEVTLKPCSKRILQKEYIGRGLCVITINKLSNFLRGLYHSTGGKRLHSTTWPLLNAEIGTGRATNILRLSMTCCISFKSALCLRLATILCCVCEMSTFPLQGSWLCTIHSKTHHCGRVMAIHCHLQNVISSAVNSANAISTLITWNSFKNVPG